MFIGDDSAGLDAFHELAVLREEGVLEEMIRVGVRSDGRPTEIVPEVAIAVDGVPA
jgi:trehalose 6-phosphate phosphatase